MKKLSYLSLLLAPALCVAQGAAPCCVTSSTQQFSTLAMDAKFIASHPEPIPFHYETEKGEWVTFKTSDSVDERAFEIKADKATNNYLFVFHEWWGLNDHIQRTAESLQKELGNVNVLALDLYDKRVAATREDASKYMGELKENRARSIISGALKYVGPKARIATIGWCMGGGWSMQGSLMAGKQAVACIMYYGMPEKDVNRLKELNAPVLMIFAKQDAWINQKVVDEFEKTMKEAKKELIVKTYDADHGFANPSNPVYNKEASADAHRHAKEFLKKYLVK